MGLSDHQLIYCTRKFSRNKVGTVKQITFCSLKKLITAEAYKQITFCSLKKLITAEAYKEALGKVCFPDYENFSDVNKAYENFIQKFMRPKKKSSLVSGNSLGENYFITYQPAYVECVWEYIYFLFQKTYTNKKIFTSKFIGTN